MMYAEFQDHMNLGSGEKVLPYNVHGDHLGHETKIFLIALCPLFSRRFHIKFGFD